MIRMSIPALVLAAIGLAACAGASGAQWYEVRCAERYQLQPGSSEFSACVARERRIVEDTQRRADRSLGSL